MTYQIEWEQDGAVKYFTGDVKFNEVLESEWAISAYSKAHSIRFVISVYLHANLAEFSEAEIEQLNVFRYEGYAVNSECKFALVAYEKSLNERFNLRIEQWGATGSTEVFTSFMKAVDWVRS